MLKTKIIFNFIFFVVCSNICSGNECKEKNYAMKKFNRTKSLSLGKKKDIKSAFLDIAYFRKITSNFYVPDRDRALRYCKNLFYYLLYQDKDFEEDVNLLEKFFNLLDSSKYASYLNYRRILDELLSGEDFIDYIREFECHENCNCSLLFDSYLKKVNIILEEMMKVRRGLLCFEHYIPSIYKCSKNFDSEREEIIAVPKDLTCELLIEIEEKNRMILQDDESENREILSSVVLYQRSIFNKYYRTQEYWRYELQIQLNYNRLFKLLIQIEREVRLKLKSYEQSDMNYLLKVYLNQKYTSKNEMLNERNKILNCETQNQCKVKLSYFNFKREEVFDRMTLRGEGIICFLEYETDEILRKLGYHPKRMIYREMDEELYRNGERIIGSVSDNYYIIEKFDRITGEVTSLSCCNGKFMEIEYMFY